MPQHSKTIHRLDFTRALLLVIWLNRKLSYRQNCFNRDRQIKVQKDILRKKCCLHPKLKKIGNSFPALFKICTSKKSPKRQKKLFWKKTRQGCVQMKVFRETRNQSFQLGLKPAGPRRLGVNSNLGLGLVSPKACDLFLPAHAKLPN